MSCDKVVELIDYKVSYDDGKVINYRNIEIFKNELVGIMGKSGCGKTTLLNSLFALDFRGKREYSCGNILGQDLQSMNHEKYKFISYMPQYSQDALNPLLRIDKIVKLILKCNNISYDENKIIELLKNIDLSEEVLFKHPYELSGGMKQRIVMLLSYIKNPEIFILDEPSSALDFITLKAIVDFIKSIRGSRTIVIVSHNKEFLNNLCDRIIYI